MPCFLEADWPLIGGSFSVDGVHVLWPRLPIQRVTDAPAQSIDVDLIHTRLAQTFPAHNAPLERESTVETRERYPPSSRHSPA